MSSELKHTPGPWVKEPGTNVIWSANEKGTPQIPIATVIHSKRPWHKKVDLEEVEANANLMSAAPTMYKALNEALSYLQSFADEWEEGEEILHMLLMRAKKLAEGKEA